ncbi:MAG: adenine phosphoribosyltransferase [Kordiimonas sp.]
MGKDIKEYIRTVPDFPKQGVMFRDVTTLFADADGFRLMLDQLQAAVGELDIDAVVGIDARGFIIGGALADRLGVGFVPIRKKGKLPADTFEEEYELEYGSAVLELHQDAVAEDTNVLLVDDLIATGGTILAAAKLLDKVGANIKACAFIVSLPDLRGEAKLVAAGHNIVSLCRYDGD